MKRVGKDPEKVNAEVEYHVVLIAHRHGLDLDKPADRLVAIEKAAKQHPELFERQRRANSVPVGKIPLTE